MLGRNFSERGMKPRHRCPELCARFLGPGQPELEGAAGTRQGVAQGEL